MKESCVCNSIIGLQAKTIHGYNILVLIGIQSNRGQRRNKPKESLLQDSDFLRLLLSHYA